MPAKYVDFYTGGIQNSIVVAINSFLYLHLHDYILNNIYSSPCIGRWKEWAGLGLAVYISGGGGGVRWALGGLWAWAAGEGGGFELVQLDQLMRMTRAP